MFCPNCGKPAADGDAFCTGCGVKLPTIPEAPVSAPAITEDSPTTLFTPTANDEVKTVSPSETQYFNVAPAIEPEAEAAPAVEPEVEAAPAVAPVVETAPAAPAPQDLPFDLSATASSFATADFGTASGGKRKKEKKPLSAKKGVAIACVITALVAVLGGSIWYYWQSVSGFFVKTFGSPEAYLQHVEKQAIADTADAVADYYGLLLRNTDSNATKGTMKLKVSDKLTQLMGGSGMDLSFLNNSTLSYETIIDGEFYMFKLSLAVSKTDIVDMVAYVNMTTGEYYLALPSLGDEYLHYAPDYFMPTAGASMMFYDQDFLKALPDEQLVNALITKYLQIVIDNIDDVEKSSETLEIGDLEQKVTVLEYEITSKDAIKIVKAILKEAKNDKDLKRIINNMADYLETQGLITGADEAYDAFQESVEMALESLDEVSTVSDEVLVLTDYVNSASEVIGRKMVFNDMEIFDCVTLTKGKKFATEWSFGDGAAVFSGEGTISDDVRDGEYALTVEGMEIMEIELSYDEKKLDDGVLDGRILLTPGSDLLRQMGAGSGASLIASMNVGLELVFTGDSETAGCEFNIVSGSEVLLGLTMDASATGKKSIQLPSDYIDTDYAYVWARELDWDKLISAMERAGLPDTIVDALESQLYYMTNPYYYY